MNVGLSHDTAEFAVESIRQWWRAFGKKHYPKTRELLICADSGGGNAARSRLWKAKLQEFADQSGIAITVAHYPPGTSKWNKIEHRMFSFISLNWKGKPLVNYETVVNLIGATKTRKGLQIKARLDRRSYGKGKRFRTKSLITWKSSTIATFRHGIILYARVPNPPEEAKITTYFFTNP